MSRNAKPQVIRRGSVAVKLYTVSNRSAGTTYRQFVLAYRDADGRRRLRKFSELGLAQTEAELTATKLAAGEAEVLRLTSSDRTQYLQARALADGLAVPLVAAMEDYAAAKALLPAGTSLVTVLEFYRQRHQVSELTVAEAVRRYLASRTAAGCCAAHVRGVAGTLSGLAEALVGPLGSLTMDGIRGHLEERWARRAGPGPLSARTRRNQLKVLKAFVRHAVRQRWLSRGWIEDLEALELPETLPGTVEVFSPAELGRLLTVAAATVPDLLPYLAIGAFAGLRTAEIHRLDWGHVDFDQGYVEVTARNAKVRGRRRLVPLSANLRAWLAPLAREHGRILPPTGTMGCRRIRLAAEAGVPWKRNALRHSFISYRCALTKNVAQVSYEAGNSPAIIHTHYLNARREAEARAWFDLRPAVPCETVPVP